MEGIEDLNSNLLIHNTNSDSKVLILKAILCILLPNRRLRR